MTTGKDEAVTAYLLAVWRELDDLPAAERDDLLQDIEAHLEDVASEFDSPTEAALVERLGTAREYVTELRESAGYTEVKVRKRLRTKRSASVDRRSRAALWMLVLSCVMAPLIVLPALWEQEDQLVLAVFLTAGPAVLGAVLARAAGMAALAALPESQWVKRIVARLRPANPPPVVRTALPHVRTTWLVLRGWVAALAFGTLLGIASEMLPIPHLSFRGLVGATLIAGGIAGSFLLASRSREDRRWWWIVLPFNVAAAFALLVAPQVFGAAMQPVVAEQPQEEPVHDGVMRHRNGDAITNLYLFDKDGNPLTDVFVYDQQGRPVDLPRKYCKQDPGVSANYVQTSEPGDNRFPKPWVYESYDEDNPQEVCKVSADVPFTITEQTPKPTPAPTATPSPTPSPTQSQSPTPTPTPTPAKSPAK